MGNGALPPLPGWILRMKKGVLFALLVGGMDHDLRRADDVHVHFHAHLEKEQLGVGLQTVDFQDVRVVRVIHPHPQVGVHAGGELAEHHRVFGDSHDRDDALALEAIAVDLGILGILDLLVRDILVIRVPGVPIRPQRSEMSSFGSASDISSTSHRAPPPPRPRPSARSFPK